MEKLSGYKKMAESSVFICGLARDIGDKLLRLQSKVETLGSLFKDYRVFIYENDSKDNTPQILKAWAADNQKVSYKSTILNAPRLTDLSPDRISLVSKYRNSCLNEMWRSHFTHHHDYMIVLDWDIYTFLLDGIANSFTHDGWDAITSNGRCSISLIRTDDVYYDAFAHEDALERLVRPKRLMGAFRLIQQGYSKFTVGDPLVPIDSGFNGLAIYKVSSLKNCTYGMIPGYAEHVHLHRAMAIQGKDNIFMNPSQLVMYDKTVFKKYLEIFKSDGLTADRSGV